ncbi:MAG: hypothetical protein ABIL68_10755 [bacterium]
MKKLLFETDWLASKPVFYNEKTCKASHNINEVIDYCNLEFDPEGFNNFLDFGYSVLEQTPVKHIKFLRHSSRLFEDSAGRLTVEYLDDPVEDWLDRASSVADVLSVLQSKIKTWENSCNGEIIIPTSGGYDSRLLNLLVEDKSRIRSFSFGLSKKQSDSHEVVYAKKISEILGIRWEQIPLGDYHLYFDDWDRLFGVSTHAHGMYHIEFYEKIKPRVSGGNPFLSGIIGDAWAGSFNIPNIESPQDITFLGYSHGMNADSNMSRLRSERSNRRGYFITHRERLDDWRLRVIEAMRFKIILLFYLVTVPLSFGFRPWSPFLDIEVAMAMLNLPPEHRRNRAWQRHLFHSRGLDVENMGLRVNETNLLNFEALRRYPLQPLDSSLLGEVVQPSYLEWINRNLHQSSIQKIGDVLFDLRKLGGAIRRLGFQRPRDRISKAYCAYLVLKPIENLMKRRERSH